MTEQILEPINEPLPDDDLWPTEGPAKGVRVKVPTAVLSIAVVAAALGIWGGAILQKHYGKTSVATRAASAASTAGTGAAGAAGGANGSTANGQGGGQRGAGGRGFAGAGGGTFGTVASVDGNTITLTQQDGSTVKVIVPSDATIMKSDTGTVSDIKPGQTLVVRGTPGADGSTTAQTVTIGGAGGVGRARGGPSTTGGA